MNKKLTGGLAKTSAGRWVTGLGSPQAPEHHFITPFHISVEGKTLSCTAQQGMAFRVPTPNVSVVDLTVRLEKPAKYEDCTTLVSRGQSCE